MDSSGWRMRWQKLTRDQRSAVMALGVLVVVLPLILFVVFAPTNWFPFATEPITPPTPPITNPLPTTSIPYIQVIQPNGGETLAPNQAYTITWQSYGVNQVAIDLVDGNGSFSTIALPMSASVGQYAWTVPTSWYGTSQAFKIKIYESPSKTISDLSNNTFAISFSPTPTPTPSPTPTPTPSPTPTPQANIQITQPMGGETLVIGNPYTIQWQASNIATISGIWFQQNSPGSTQSHRISFGVPASTTSFTWIVSMAGITNPTAQSTYRFLVSAPNGSGVSQNVLIATPTPVSCNQADINRDGIVDATDYTLLLADFFKTNPTQPRSDINHDGIVDATDYSLLVANYLQQTGICQ